MSTNKEREWIDADNLREVIGMWDALLADDDHEDMHGMLDDLRALFPTPQPRTLKDMTPEEREACQWSMVETPNDEGVFIKQSGNDALVIYPSGRHIFWDLDLVVPMLDMPRMVWPTDTPEVEERTYAPDWDMITKAIRSEKEHLIDVQDYEGTKRWLDAERALGTAMGTNPPREPSRLPLPEDAPDGHYLVRWWGEERPVPAEKVRGQWWAIGRAGILPAKDVLIVSRLIPEGGQATEETPDPPRPEDVPEGEIWLIRPYENADPTPAFRVHGSQYGPGKRWAHYVTGSSMLRFEDDDDITLVSRLVPEVKA